jgi:hypothetical protein
MCASLLRKRLVLGGHSSGSMPLPAGALAVILSRQCPGAGLPSGLALGAAKVARECVSGDILHSVFIEKINLIHSKQCSIDT